MGYIVELKSAAAEPYILVPDADQADVTPTGHLVLKRRSGSQLSGYENLAIFEPSSWHTVYADQAAQKVIGSRVLEPYGIDALKARKA